MDAACPHALTSWAALSLLEGSILFAIGGIRRTFETEPGRATTPMDFGSRTETTFGIHSIEIPSSTEGRNLMLVITWSTHSTGVGSSSITMPIVCTNTIRHLFGSLSHFPGGPIPPFLEVRALGLREKSGPMGRWSVPGRSWAQIGRDMVGRGMGDVSGNRDPIQHFVTDVVMFMLAVVVVIVYILKVNVDVVMNALMVVVIVVNIVMDLFKVVVIVVG